MLKVLSLLILIFNLKFILIFNKVFIKWLRAIVLPSNNSPRLDHHSSCNTFISGMITLRTIPRIVTQRKWLKTLILSKVKLNH